MKKILRYFYAHIASPKKDLKKILNNLDVLKKQMNEIQLMPNKVEAIVRLFQVLSPLQDKGGFSQTYHKLLEKNYGQLNEAIKAIESIQKHIANCGRKQALNRSEPGEEVTAANVYLGEVWGIWCKPASYFLQHQRKLDLEDSGVTPSATCKRGYVSVWYCINDYQASPFVESHTNGILRNIEVLRKMAV